MRQAGRMIAGTLCALLIGGVSWPVCADDEIDEILGMSMRALMDLEVTIASRKKETYSDTAAAVYVITAEDIRRLGVSSIMDALRVVPGLHVARQESSQWAISARGFNDQFSNKLLVLVDGRTVYTPLFSGVFWDEQEIPPEDVERIEVVRGPGAAVWGANAVNGVINIITKSAEETQGGQVTLATGSRDRGEGSIRYGGRGGEKKDWYYHVHGRYLARDDEPMPTGGDARDDWNMGRGGVRLDWLPEDRPDRFTISGEYYDADENRDFVVPSLSAPYSTTLADETVNVRGGHVLGRWERDLGEDEMISLQAYVDQSERDYAVLGIEMESYDLEFQHSFRPHDRHELVWGVGYRHQQDHLRNTTYISFMPEERYYNLYNFFVQDKYALWPAQNLSLITGARFEHNSFTGFEVQPSARMLWQPDDRHTVWGSVSRAVRTPSRGLDDVNLSLTTLPPGSLGAGTPATLVQWRGDRDGNSESAIVYELGYRVEWDDRVSFDVTTFYHDYTDMLGQEPQPPVLDTSGPSPYLVMPMVFENNVTGKTFGVESAAYWDVTSNWRLSASYAFLRMIFNNRDGSLTTHGEENERTYPHHTAHLRSYLNLPHNMEFDTALYFVDGIEEYDIPDYLRLDARIGWKPVDGVELSLTGRNLLDDRHQEYGPGLYAPSIAPSRAWYGKITWQF